MYKWCENNQITLNSKKCEYIHLCYRKPVVRNLELKLGNILLKQVQQYKYLGTVIAEKLTGEAYHKVISIQETDFF